MTRKLHGWLPWFAVLLMASVAAADPPKAVITGLDGNPPPETVEVGDMHALSADKSDGADHLVWRVTIRLTGTSAKARAEEYKRLTHRVESLGGSIEWPKTDSAPLYAEVSAGHSLLMPAKPGYYRVTLAASNKDGASIDEYERTIDGGPTPNPPGPNPPPDPTPQPVGLSALVAAEVAKVVTADTKDAWLAWGTVYDSIANLAESTPFDTVQQFLAADMLARSVPTVVSTKWQTVQENVVAPQLQALADKGGLTTVTDYAKTWREIAAGVKTGAGAQPPPKPVDPVVPPAPVTDKMRVLIRYDTTKAIPAEQESILTSKPVRDWLDANVGKANYRIWDQTITGQDEAEQFWRDAGKLPYNSLPWLFVTGGKAPGFNDKLPANPAAALSILKGLKP